MISFLKGTLVATDVEGAIVEVGGIGYRLSMSMMSISKLGTVGSQVMVLAYLHLREDAITLYGFASDEERSLFEKLITVSGVGPKVALSALSHFEVAELIGAIVSQNVAAVQKIPGVGKKTASRIVLELKDALSSDEGTLFASSSGATSQSSTSSATVDALLSMGFTSAEADLALKDAPKDASESELLRYALKRLGE